MSIGRPFEGASSEAGFCFGLLFYIFKLLLSLPSSNISSLYSTVEYQPIKLWGIRKVPPRVFIFSNMFWYATVHRWLISILPLPLMSPTHLGFLLRPLPISLFFCFQFIHCQGGLENYPVALKSRSERMLPIISNLWPPQPLSITEKANIFYFSFQLGKKNYKSEIFCQWIKKESLNPTECVFKGKFPVWIFSAAT